MKWIIFTGTWKLINQEVENDVRQAVRDVISLGNGMVTGGATGVDYIAMDEWLKHDKECKKLRVFIPANLDNYINDYYKNWCHDPITKDDIEKLEKVLRDIQSVNQACLLEMKHDGGDITQNHYDLRHNEEVMFADEVHAFQVNNSTGTQDTIDKAEKFGLTISLHKKYTI